MRKNIAGIKIEAFKHRDKVILTLSTVDGMVDFSIHLNKDEIDELCNMLQYEKSK